MELRLVADLILTALVDAAVEDAQDWLYYARMFAPLNVEHPIAKKQKILVTANS